MNTTTRKRGRYAKRTHRGRKTLLVALIVAAALALIGACTAEQTAELDPAAETEPVVTEEPAAVEPVVEEEPEPEPVVEEFSDAEIFEMAIQLTLDMMTAAELNDFCYAWDLMGPDASIETIAYGYGPGWDDSIGRRVIGNFADSAC